MKQAYITALTDSLLLGKEYDVVLKNMQELLAKKGHERLWPVILKGVVRELEKRNRANTPHVIVSSEVVQKNVELIKALEAVGVTTPTDLKTSVDSSIIGGFIVRYRDLMVDASYKRALTDLYQKVTKS